MLKMKIEPAFVLFFDCPEEELTKSTLNRNQASLLHILVDESLPMRVFSWLSYFLLKGRVDDNIDILSKRHKAYFETTLPVIITTLFVWLS
jgi:UMP-CMP kinase